MHVMNESFTSPDDMKDSFMTSHHRRENVARFTGPSNVR